MYFLLRPPPDLTPLPCKVDTGVFVEATCTHMHTHTHTHTLPAGESTADSLVRAQVQEPLLGMTVLSIHTCIHVHIVMCMHVLGERTCIVYVADCVREFNAREVKAATDDFSSEVGRGGFGTVFRGTFKHLPVAVKVLNKVSQGGQPLLCGWSRDVMCAVCLPVPECG